MTIELTQKQFRRLLDLVYTGNWIMNSIRGEDRFKDYDEVESLVFAQCITNGMTSLVESFNGELIPSRKFAEGGIHEAIMTYEDTVFFEILAEELARRDMDYEDIGPHNFDELTSRIDAYISEFEANGTDNIVLDI
ncbi:MAG: hypothetical protein E7430_09265 [Ruminococcaceae bacterium]|nr:hypothetical protein [Oscillospiraceae bacterium]